MSKSGATVDQVNEIRKQCDELVEFLSKRTGLSRFQVAKEIHYRIQRAPAYRINPTKTDKTASIKRHGDCCSVKGPGCKGLREEFHHIRRDIDNPHCPDNMVPICKSCHAQTREPTE